MRLRRKEAIAQAKQAERQRCIRKLQEFRNEIWLPAKKKESLTDTESAWIECYDFMIAKLSEKVD